MASFQSIDATVHKNITSTHSSIQFLLSQINPNCTINIFLGTLYRCNGGRILTVVRAQNWSQDHENAAIRQITSKIDDAIIFGYTSGAI